MHHLENLLKRHGIDPDLDVSVGPPETRLMESMPDQHRPNGVDEGDEPRDLSLDHLVSPHPTLEAYDHSGVLNIRLSGRMAMYIYMDPLRLSDTSGNISASTQMGSTSSLNRQPVARSKLDTPVSYPPPFNFQKLSMTSVLTASLLITHVGVSAHPPCSR